MAAEQNFENKKTIFFMTSFILGVFHTANIYPGWLFYDSATQWLWAKEIITHLRMPNSMHTQWPILNTLLKVPFYFLSGEPGLFILIQSTIFFYIFFFTLCYNIRLVKTSYFFILLAAFSPAIYNYSIFHSADTLIGMIMLAGTYTFFIQNLNYQRKIAILSLLTLLGVYIRYNFIFVALLFITYLLYITFTSIAKIKNFSIFTIAILILSFIPVKYNFGLQENHVEYQGSLLRLWYLYTTNKLKANDKKTVETFVDSPEDDFDSRSFDGIWASLNGKIKNSPGKPDNNAKIISLYMKYLASNIFESFIDLKYFIFSALGISKPLLDCEVGRFDTYKLTKYDGAFMQSFYRIYKFKKFYIDSHHLFLRSLSGYFSRPYILFLSSLVIVLFSYNKFTFFKFYTFLLLVSFLYYFPFIFVSGNHEFRYFFPSFVLLYVLHAHFFLSLAMFFSQKITSLSRPLNIKPALIILLFFLVSFSTIRLMSS